MLPISNPANLVIYGSHMPPLLQWLPRFCVPSLLSIVATYLVLRWTQRARARPGDREGRAGPDAVSAAARPPRSGSRRRRSCCSPRRPSDVALGLPTAMAGAVTAAVVLIRDRKAPWAMVKDISWGVLPLVAGLFVLVEALDQTGLIAVDRHARCRTRRSARRPGAAWGSGLVVAFASNLMNNLPAGLIAGSAVQNAHAARPGDARRPDRRRPRAEPVGDRLAGDHPVAHGAAPRRPERRRLARSSSSASW